MNEAKLRQHFAQQMRRVSQGVRHRALVDLRSAQDEFELGIWKQMWRAQIDAMLDALLELRAEVDGSTLPS